MHRGLVILALGAGSLGYGQILPDQSSQTGAGQGAAQDGARIYQLSLFGGYSTSANPLGVGQFTSGGVAALNADENYGVSAAVGWQRHRDKGGFSIEYTGSYSGMVHYSDANGYSQTLSLNGDRKLTPKLRVNFSANGQDATLIQVLNEPAAISITSQLPADFNDFAATFGLGNFSTAAAASSILGAPVVQAPIRALLLGDKILSYSGNAGINYNYSRHLTFHASTFGSGGESRAGGQGGIPQTNFAMPRSIGANAGLSYNYSPSPRTDMGLSVEGNTLQNHFQSAYTSTASASIGRKMGMHWFSRVYGGGTYTDITKQLTGRPQTLQAVGGGSIGIKGYTENFVVTYERSASDSYATAVGTFTNLSGSWNWRRPGSRFSTFSSVSQQQTRNTGFESFSGWQAGAGVAEQLSDTASFKAQYVYFRTVGSYLGTPSGFTVHSVRLSMNWSPQTVPR